MTYPLASFATTIGIWFTSPFYKLLKKDNNYKVTWLAVAEPALRQRQQEQW